MAENQERYLGDGVYASHDGYHIWLDTRAQNPVNRIALEPSVFDALLRYKRDLDPGPPSSEMPEEAKRDG